MQCSFFLAADFANQDASGKLNIIGVFDRIYVEQFPATHPSLYLVVKLKADLGEYDIVRPFGIPLFDEDGKQLGEMKGSVTIGTPRAGERSEANLIVNIPNLVFEKAGRYEFKLLVSDHIMAELPIDVVEHPQAQES